MYTLIIVLTFIVCALLILLVLVQNSKGGGLASSFSGSNQVMGVRKTSDFLEKGTWILAIALVILCISATAFLPHKEMAKSAIDQQIENVQDPNALPTFPQAMPEQGGDTTKAN